MMDSKKNKFGLFLIYFFPFAIILGNFFINAVVIFSAITFFITKKKNINMYLNFLQIMVFTIFLASLLFSSFFVSANKIASILAVIKLPLSLFFSLHIAATLSNNKVFEKYIKFLSYFVLVVAMDGWVQFIFGKNILGFEPFMGHGIRLTGIFKDEAVLGSFISKLSLIVFCYCYFFNKNKYISVIISFIIILSTIISNERMATISVIGGFLIFIIYYSIIFLKELKFLFLMPMTIILVFFFINNNNRIYDQLIIKTDRYVGGFSKPLNIIDSPHGAHWLTAYKIFKNNLYIGSGLKNFKIKCSKNIYSSPIKFNEERCSTHPHNMLLEFLSETGILGTIMFLTFLFTITLKKIIFFKNPYYCSIFLSIILYLFPLATSGSFFSTWNGGFFWLFLGLLLALQRNLKKTS